MTGNRWPARVATGALLILAAPTEYALGAHVLLIPPYLAWLVPVIVELYFAVALETKRDRVLATVVFLGSLLVSTGVHLAQVLGVEVGVAARLGLLLVFLGAATAATIRLHAMASSSEAAPAVVEAEVPAEVQRVVSREPDPTLFLDVALADEPEPEPQSWDERDVTYPAPGEWGTGTDRIDRGVSWSLDWEAHHPGQFVTDTIVGARMGIARDRQPRSVVSRVEKERPAPTPFLRAVAG